MKVTEKDVAYLAGLANLELTPDETTRFAADLDSILAYVEKLNELDTSAVEPMAQVLYDAGDTATLRADSERPRFTQERALADAPESGGGHFKVPKVIAKND